MTLGLTGLAGAGSLRFSLQSACSRRHKPYGATDNLPFWGRLLYWTGLIFLGAYTGEFTELALKRAFPRLPYLLVLLIIALAATVVVTAAIFAVESVINKRSIPLRFLPTLFGPVFVISAAMTGFGALMQRAWKPDDPAAAKIDGPQVAAAFLERLPIKYRGALLYAVSSEDHYLRVHTDKGEELILMRLADAIRELSGAEGLQTHRSWWVAKRGVADTNRIGGKLQLILKSGAEVPVSRSFTKAVREAGLV